MNENMVVYVLGGIIISQFALMATILWQMPFNYTLKTDHDNSRKEILTKLDGLCEKVDDMKKEYYAFLRKE